jgi:hypothetical protein
MTTRPAVFLSALLFACVTAGQEQPALVTFYSAGCHPCGKALAVTIGAGSAPCSEYQHANETAKIKSSCFALP